MNGTTLSTSGQNTMQGEAGASDNRLSLNPSDPRWADTIGAWKDGKKYKLTIEVNQISPGEFEVSEAEGSAVDAAEPAEENNEGDTASPDRYPNPAVAAML